MELAVLVDKYDCAAPLRMAISSIFFDLRSDSLECEDYETLTTAAYVLDQPEHFRFFSRELVLRKDTHFFGETLLQHFSASFLHKSSFY